MKRGIRLISISSRGVAFLLRLALGSAFVYAGILKHLNPYQFTETVIAYQLLPQSLVGLTVAIIPWLEIICGALLIFGLKRRSCLLLIQAVLIIFMIILGITMLRGLNIDCGCGLFSEREVGFLAMLEDGLLLGIAGWLYALEIRRSLPTWGCRQGRTGPPQAGAGSQIWN